ncbi:MAG: phosphodiester glycosidase family protein [bacterium]|nr:phosphodiester glycosidase family protein [bacterium]
MNNCNTIKPGEFSHASNPNPRSALGIKADGTTLLVTVQGRGTNAAGMDLEQLAQLMVGLGCHWAINLDGGRSSRMAWRNPGETLVRLSAGAQEGMSAAEAYPVGSVIAFVKAP